MLYARLNRSLAVFLAKTPWPELPREGELLLIADAMVKRIARQWYTIYVVLVRRADTTEAVIAPPFLRAGTETIDGWAAALDALPASVRNRTKALVSDGHRGLVYYARWKGWVVQRCHFHLLASIQGRRSRWGQSRHREEGERCYRLVKEVLTTPDEIRVLPLLNEIEALAWETTSPQLRKVLFGFATNIRHYRSYLVHPELNLPITSNAVESLIGALHELCHRARGFRTLESFSRWIAALIKERRVIRCNGSNQPISHD